MFIVVYLREHSGVLLVPCLWSSSGPGPSWVRVRKVRVRSESDKLKHKLKGEYKKYFKVEFKGGYPPP